MYLLVYLSIYLSGDLSVFSFAILISYSYWTVHFFSCTVTKYLPRPFLFQQNTQIVLRFPRDSFTNETIHLIREYGMSLIIPSDWHFPLGLLMRLKLKIGLKCVQWKQEIMIIKNIYVAKCLWNWKNHHHHRPFIIFSWSRSWSWLGYVLVKPSSFFSRFL